MERAAEKASEDLFSVVRKMQNLVRPLNAAERRGLGEWKQVYETVCHTASSIWDRQAVRPRTPGWMQYEFTGVRAAIDLLLADPD